MQCLPLGTALSCGSNQCKTFAWHDTRSFYPPTLVDGDARFVAEEVLGEGYLAPGLGENVGQGRGLH